MDTVKINNPEQVKEICRTISRANKENRTPVPLSLALRALQYAKNFDMEKHSDDLVAYLGNTQIKDDKEVSIFVNDTLSSEDLKILDSFLGWHGINGSNLVKDLAPVLHRCNMSNEPDSLRKKLIDFGGEKYLENIPYSNLTSAKRACKKDVTVEDLKSVTTPNGPLKATAESSSASASDAFKKAQGQLAIEYLEKGKLKDAITEEWLQKAIIQGYKDNPDAFKKTGMEVDRRIIDAMAKDEEMSQNPAFKYIIVERTQEASTISPEILKEIEEKGLDAGFGVELIANTMTQHIAHLKPEAEQWRREADELRQKANLYDQTQNREKLLKAMTEDMQSCINLSEAQRCGLSPEKIEAMLFDKAHGKDVVLQPSKEKPSKGFLGLFVDKEKNKRIEQYNKDIQNLQKNIDSFAEKYKTNPLTEQYSSLESMMQQCETDRLYLQSHHKPDVLLGSLERKISQYDKMVARVTPALNKVYEQKLSQMNDPQFRDTQINKSGKLKTAEAKLRLHARIASKNGLLPKEGEAEKEAPVVHRELSSAMKQHLAQNTESR